MGMCVGASASRKSTMVAGCGRRFTQRQIIRSLRHMALSWMKRAFFLALLLLTETSAVFADSSRLPDGTEFPTWEQPLHFTKTYYIDANAQNALDSGPGTKDRPFRTIDHAAQVLQPGEHVVIASGVYREAIRPARGGTGPDAMISYEAAPGAEVVVAGAVVTTGWQPSEGWNIGPDRETNQPVKACDRR